MTCLWFNLGSFLADPLDPFKSPVAMVLFFGHHAPMSVSLRATELFDAEIFAHRNVDRLGGMEDIP